MRLLIVTEWAAQVGRSVAACRMMLKGDRVSGAKKAGIHYLIPEGTPYPAPRKPGAKRKKRRYNHAA
jgi:hypothetical protein